MTTFPAVLTDTGTFTDYDGILISHIGEDGGMVALGHHDETAARAAFLQLDDWWAEDDMPILTTWAVLTDPTPAEGEAAPWWMQWGVDADTPGAFPVMVVEA